jgi:transcriptional regulator with XRE-family HTH domain
VPPTIKAELHALATAVREIRARRKLTQERVGEDGGVGRKYVGQMERGEVVPSFASLVGVARGLDVPLSELVRVYEERLRGTGGGGNGGGPSAHGRPHGGG